MQTKMTVGARVRRYYTDDCYDEGEVRLIEDGRIEVDFFDWIECWQSAEQFQPHYIWHEGVDVLVPLEDGDVIAHFGRKL